MEVGALVAIQLVYVQVGGISILTALQDGSHHAQQQQRKSTSPHARGQKLPPSSLLWLAPARTWHSFMAAFAVGERFAPFKSFDQVGFVSTAAPCHVVGSLCRRTAMF